MVATLQTTDLGKTDDRWKCTPVREITQYAGAGYWAWKTLRWLLKVPV